MGLNPVDKEELRLAILEYKSNELKYEKRASKIWANLDVKGIIRMIPPKFEKTAIASNFSYPYKVIVPETKPTKKASTRE